MRAIFHFLPTFSQLLLVGLSTFVVIFSSQSSANNDYETCAVCHADDGSGNQLLGAPAIAGLPSWYVSRQLRLFKSTARGHDSGDVYGQQMAAAVTSLSNEKLNNVTQLVAKMPIKSTEITVVGDARRGQNIYNGNCGACHGSQGEGNNALNAPRLNNQHSDYLIRQINLFKSGKRGNDPSDKFGRQMAMMAATIASDQEVLDVLAYLQQKNNKDSK